MKEKSMTALISAFARAYHNENHENKIFADSIAKSLFTGDEYDAISQSIASGIKFFDPSFKGDEASALKKAVEKSLAPSPLGRAAFCESALETAAVLGSEQYLILAAGYDTFSYRQPKWAEKMRIFEIDYPSTAADKKARLKRAGITAPKNVNYIEIDFEKENIRDRLCECKNFDRRKISFCSLLGLLYYVSSDDFKRLISSISEITPCGSSVVFDYPDEKSFEDIAGERIKKQCALASGAGEKMVSCYSYDEMEAILADCGFLIYEHLTPNDITKAYFKAYNDKNPESKMSALESVNYCLAVKR